MDPSSRDQRGLEVGFGLPTEQRWVAAEILYEAFQQKFRPMFGSRDLAVKYVAGNFKAQRVVTATLNGSIVGIGGLKYGNEGPMDYGLRRLIQCLGPVTMRFLLVGMIFMLTRVPKDELYIDMIAVSSRFRGRGIGGEMLDFILTFAREQGFSGVSLHVIDTNPEARKFYAERGFLECGYIRIFPWDRILGFKGAYKMLHRL